MRESVVLDPAIQRAVGHRIGSGTGQAPYRWETKHVRVSSKAISITKSKAISVTYSNIGFIPNEGTISF